MKRIWILLLCSSLHAMNYQPWFNPLLEFQSTSEYEYQYSKTLQSPLGNSEKACNENYVSTNLQVSPWPYWDAQFELDLAGTTSVTFNFAAFQALGRYQWLDDTVGDVMSLTTGVHLLVPRALLLANDSFYYVGHVNVDFNVGVGKAFYCGQSDWRSRVWLYAGYGVASQGSPWFDTYLEWDQRICERWVYSLTSRFIYGTGSNNINPNLPFPGYASLNFQAINLFMTLSYSLPACGTFSLFGTYNVHARNSPLHFYGGGGVLQIPFSL